jgi:hypothetical protein
MCCVWLSEQTVTLPFTPLIGWFFIIEVESVYCAVRTESLYNTDKSRPLKVSVVSLNEQRISYTRILLVIRTCLSSLKIMVFLQQKQHV